MIINTNVFRLCKKKKSKHTIWFHICLLMSSIFLHVLVFAWDDVDNYCLNYL